MDLNELALLTAADVGVAPLKLDAAPERAMLAVTLSYLHQQQRLQAPRLWMDPAAARQLAAQLLDAANQAETSTNRTPPGSGTRH